MGRWSIALAAVGMLAGVARAATIELVPVGNPGNASDDTGHGAVGYVYAIGAYEVTSAEYTEFLNAVAAADAFGLYDPSMASGPGCRIQRDGTPGAFTYSVAPDWARRPVNFVDWGDAARFANWLHNGKPTGSQDVSTTEAGSYLLNGAVTPEDLLTVTRQPGATWVIPTEDERYKAAYHKNDGATGNYWDYPTGSDLEPSNDLVDPDPGNNANFYVIGDGYTLGPPYWRTEVGAFENSASPYGTFDQGGNQWEWTESIANGAHVYRGGTSDDVVAYLHAAAPPAPVSYGHSIGFRLAHVPEPDSLAMLAGLASMGWFCRRRTRSGPSSGRPYLP